MVVGTGLSKRTKLRILTVRTLAYPGTALLPEKIPKSDGSSLEVITWIGISFCKSLFLSLHTGWSATCPWTYVVMDGVFLP